MGGRPEMVIWSAEGNRLFLIFLDAVLSQRTVQL